MSRKSVLAKEIHLLEEEIKILEAKRSRSQAALIEALISRKEPDETDVQFFRAFTADIEMRRERMQELTKQLEDLL